MKTLQKISALVMVIVLFMAALPVSAASVTPEYIPGNPTCKDVGFPEEYKFDPPTSKTVDRGIYGFITLTMVDSRTINWSSTGIVYAVLVKAGSGANLYDYGENGAVGDWGLISPSHNAISHVSICYKTPAIETGDAPDSTNHYGWDMPAYYNNSGAVVAWGNFPTVADSTVVFTGTVGMCHYVAPNGAYLGAGRSAERDADLFADPDTNAIFGNVTNLYSPVPDVIYDNFDSDDGLDLPPYWDNGVPTTITYTVSVPASSLGGVSGYRYVNLWFDWDRNGVWGDSVNCLAEEVPSRSTVSEFGNASEYVFANEPVYIYAGESIEITQIITPCNPPYLADLFDPGDPNHTNYNYNDAPIWVRITLTGEPVDTDAQDDGSGKGSCYAEGETEDWYGDFLHPAAVELARFEAAAQDDGILIEWETATEIDNLGFNLYRSTALNGDYVQLNAALIPAQNPGAVFGGIYTWVDEDVTPGVTYFYKLEDVDIHGVATLHGPVQATALASGPSAVSLTSFAAGGGGGVWLPLALSALALLGGLKRRK